MVKEKMVQRVGEKIFRQLGGGKFVAMTGAKSFLMNNNALQFKIGKNKGGYKGVVIELTDLDLYKVTFWKTNNKYDLKSDVFEMIYADQLQELFTEHTGLDTHL